MFAQKRRLAPPSWPGFRLAARPFQTLPAYLTKLTREHGHVLRFRNFRRDVYVFTEPALVEEVLVGKGASFTKARGTQRLVRLLGRGLLTSEQPQHLRHRRLVPTGVPSSPHRRVRDDRRRSDARARGPLDERSRDRRRPRDESAGTRDRVAGAVRNGSLARTRRPWRTHSTTRFPRSRSACCRSPNCSTTFRSRRPGSCVPRGRGSTASCIA